MLEEKTTFRVVVLATNIPAYMGILYSLSFKEEEKTKIHVLTFVDLRFMTKYHKDIIPNETVECLI